jgi:hypothetical protein
MTAELDGATIDISFLRRVAASEVPTNFENITVIKKIPLITSLFFIEDNMAAELFAPPKCCKHNFVVLTKYFIH